MTSSAFTIGIIQDHATADPQANVDRAERLVRDAARQGAQIICLKELFNALYFCKSQQCDRFDLAEPIPGPTTTRMQALARELAVVIVEIAGQTIANIYDYTYALDVLKVGEPAKVVYMRSGTRLETTLTPAARRSSASRNCSTRCISARRSSATASTWRSRFPGRPPTPCRSWRRSWRS